MGTTTVEVIALINVTERAKIKLQELVSNREDDRNLIRLFIQGVG